ncbi:MAG: DUF3226 domain-containing protein [Candidatus Methylomirabilota bacterium]|jgi:hypothetical protein
MDAQRVETSRPILIEKNRLLLVEGKDEFNFFSALCRELSVSNLQPIWLEGKSNLDDKVNTLVISPEFARRVVSLGVVRDADESEASTFQSVTGALKKAGLSVPPYPQTFVGDKPKVGVLILPGNGRPGELEDLCIEALGPDPAFSCTEALFSCLSRLALPLPKELSKARVQAYLATKPEVHISLGLGALKGYLPLNSPVFEATKRFIQSVGA